MPSVRIKKKKNSVKENLKKPCGQTEVRFKELGVSFRGPEMQEKNPYPRKVRRAAGRTFDGEKGRGRGSKVLQIRTHYVRLGRRGKSSSPRTERPANSARRARSPNTGAHTHAGRVPIGPAARHAPSDGPTSTCVCKRSPPPDVSSVVVVEVVWWRRWPTAATTTTTE